VSARGLVTSAVGLAVLTVLVVSRWAPLLELDLTVGAWVHGISVEHPALVRVADVVDVAFSPSVFRVVVVVLAAWLLWARRARLAFWAVLAMTVGGVVGILGKLVVARVRPAFPDPVGHAAGYSFPSGHAINAALAVLIVLAVVVPLMRRAARVTAVVVGALVVVATGLDRMVLGVHYLSDVVAAWLAAVIVVAGSALVMDRWSAPDPVPEVAARS
jgi:membrane-associated phospholipid phosphatase